MPRYVIERQFLVPMFEHIFVEAPDLETACRRAVDDIVEPWGDHAELAFDDARSTTVTEAVEIPEDMLPELRSAEDADRYVLSELLYGSGLNLMPIPEDFADVTPTEEAGIGFT